MTTREQNDRWEVAFYQEPTTAFDTEHTTYGDYLSLVVQRDSVVPKVGYEGLESNNVRYFLDDMDKQTLGPERCSLTLSVSGHSHGMDMDGDHGGTVPDADTWPFARLHKNVMGGIRVHADQGAQTQVQAASTTTVINVTAGHGAGWVPGACIAVPTASVPNGLEIAEVASISTDAITLKQALKGVPTTGGAVRGGVTFYLVEPDSYASLQAVCEADGATDGRNLRGLLGGFTIEKTLGGLLSFAYQLQGAGWTLLGANSNISAPAYTYYSQLVANPSALSFPVVGNTARVEPCQSESTWTPNISFGPIPCGDSDNGWDGHWRQMADGGVITGSFIVPRDDDGALPEADDYYYEQWTATTEHALFEQIGDQAGSSLLLAARQVQIVDIAPAEYGPGIRGQQVTWRGRTFQSGTTDISRAAFAMHFV